MSVLFFYSLKGGSGKSVSLCSLAANVKNKRVLVIDCDRSQLSSYQWCVDREDAEIKPVIDYCKPTKNKLKALIAAKRKEYDLILIDGHGGDTAENREAMLHSDSVIIPMIPAQNDLDTLHPLSVIIQKANTKRKASRKKPIKIISFCSQIMAASEYSELKEFYDDYPQIKLLKSSISSSRAWRSVELGLGITEIKGKSKAITNTQAEFKKLQTELLRASK